LTKPVANILRKRLGERAGACIPDRLLHLFDSVAFGQGAATSFRTSQAGSDLFLGYGVNIGLDFFIEIGLRMLLAKQIAESEFEM
jgi:hypothetical protein